MKPSELICSSLEYLIETFPGSIIDTVRSRQPQILPGETNADLHTHPYISSKKTLIDTLKTLVKNHVDICTITTHGKGDYRENDYWAVKHMIEKDGLADQIQYEDKGLCFETNYQGKKLTFVPSYEMYTHLDGIDGTIDVVSLMPGKGFAEDASQGMNFEDYLTLNHNYGAIVIGAHPYTLAYPNHEKRFIRFKIASEKERHIIREKFFPFVDAVDIVSTNCAWMILSNRLLADDYPGKPLSNSDAHSKCNYTRNEIGRSGNIFTLNKYDSGDSLREQLLNKIIWGDFRTYHNPTPSMQFLVEIGFDRPPKGFP